VSLPSPSVGLVIRYSFLWSNEAQEGKDEGVKDRPCAVVVTLHREGLRPAVRVLPITHTLPADLAGAMEIPPLTKQVLGLDADRSWIILDEANDFLWPGPDVRPAVYGDWSTASYGMLPKRFMTILMERLNHRWHLKKAQSVKRTE
jgi:hypothetical protein